MEKTLAELQADWATHGLIAALKTKLFGETDDVKRIALEDQIVALSATIKLGSD
jgi:hypothetical protein